MKVYIAGGRDNRDIVQWIIDKLRHAYDHEITHNWVTEMLNEATTKKQKAELDLMGVVTADAIVLLYPGGPGTNFEFGYASAIGKPVVVVCMPNEYPLPGEIFYQRDNVILYKVPVPPENVDAKLYIADNAAILAANGLSEVAKKNLELSIKMAAKKKPPALERMRYGWKNGYFFVSTSTNDFTFTASYNGDSPRDALNKLFNDNSLVEGLGRIYWEKKIINEFCKNDTTKGLCIGCRTCKEKEG